jgi:hypothetical protein
MGSAVSMCSSSSSIVSQPAPPSSSCKSMYCYPCHGVISSGPSAFLAGQVLRRPALLQDARVPTALARVGASRGAQQARPGGDRGKGRLAGGGTYLNLFGGRTGRRGATGARELVRIHTASDCRMGSVAGVVRV